MRFTHDRRGGRGWILGCALLVLLVVAVERQGTAASPDAPESQARWKILGWSRRGLRELDADFSVFGMHPPYSGIEAQLLDPRGDRIGHPAGLTMRYEAVADPDGSINASSGGKTNFWDSVEALYGLALPVDAGLAGHDMPGAPGLQRPLPFDEADLLWRAEGIPLTPLDDAGARQHYPLMRLTAYDAEGLPLASSDVVLPVSDGMRCSSCHASGTVERAKPGAGWADAPDPERDYRLNILRLHDEKQVENPTWHAAIASLGYRPEGLFATVVRDGRPILCADCHATIDPAKTGLEGISPLSLAVHGKHLRAHNPATGLRLTEVNDRSSCTICHSGASDDAAWLRGAMGEAVDAQGALAIHCQDCHGSLDELGRADRQPWLEEPDCGSCHSGTATDNAGQIRFDSVWQDGVRRRPANPIFASEPNGLYASSHEHGGLQCPACHGPAHALRPSRERNDGLQAVALQGHGGTLGDCAVCHGTAPNSIRSGPHGMHTLGQSWLPNHVRPARSSSEECAACHGADGRGTPLSRALATRTLDSGELGQLELWPGFQVGCYACHNGPDDAGPSPNGAPVVRDLVLSAPPGRSVEIDLEASDPDGDALSLRVISRPEHGRVALEGRHAIYLPGPDGELPDRFTYAAWDGSIDSNLGQVTIQPAPGPAAGSRAWLPYLALRSGRRQAVANRALGLETNPALPR